MSTDVFEVAVIGAGPAGALAARQLALAGVSVALIDKARFPRDKVCGCCLSAAALGTLERVGLGGLPARLGARSLARVCLRAPGARAELPIRAAAVSRSALDAALVAEAVRAGAVLREQTVARVGQDDALVVRGVEGEQVERWTHVQAIVVADGLAGTALTERPDLEPRVRQGGRIGASTIVDGVHGGDWGRGYEDGAVHMTIGRGGYVGAVRLEDGRLDIAAALEPRFIRAADGPGPAIARLLAEAGMPSIAALQDARFMATPVLTRRRPTIEKGMVLILGDAAGYVEPFTGEGMAWALGSAAAIVPAVLARIHGTESVSWQRIHRREVAGRQRLCRLLAWALRRPRLAAWAIAVLGRMPGLAGPALRRLEAPWPEPAL